MVDLDKLKQIKEHVVRYVELQRGCKDSAVELSLMSAFLQATNHELARAISECVQEKLIERIEYKIGNEPMVHAFYMPQGSRLL